MSLPPILADFRRYAPRYLRVKNPEYGTIVPFRLRPIQERLDATIDAELAKGKPARVQILKARRLGCSTEVAGKFFHRAVTRRNQRGQIIAHRGPDASVLFQIYERMYEHLPESDDGIPLKPRREGGHGKALAFRGLSSSLEVASAGSSEGGRGGDAQLLHGSECAFWPDPEKLVGAMMAQIPVTGDAIVVLESTANGPGTWWHTLWQRSKDHASGYVPLFFAWFDDPYNRLPNAVSDEDWTDEEKEYHERYSLDGHQLAWLRLQEEVTCFGNVDLRHREFPSTEDEAFVAVGKPAWSSETVLACLERVEPLWRGLVTEHGIRKGDGDLLVWEDALARAQYVIGVDTASEIDSGEADLSVISVWRAGSKPGEWPIQVAEWAGNVDVYNLAMTVSVLGHSYNKAMAAVEINGIGRPTQNLLSSTFHYPYCYRYQRWDAHKAARDTWGWQCVSPASRILMKDLRWVRADDIKVGDEIIGCHEKPPGGKGRSNLLRKQCVVEVSTFMAPVVDVELENGQRTLVSSTHPFWARQPDARQWGWVLAQDLRPGDCVKYLSPWQTLTTYDAGRLSAFLDGEGHLSQHHRHPRSTSGFDLLVSQAEGPLAEEICALWFALGFEATTIWTRHKNRPHKSMMTAGVRRFPDVLRALGSLRPTRLLRTFAGTDLGRRSIKALSTVPVRRVEAVGHDRVVGLTTEPDHTLIADGIVGHNTTPNTKDAMLGIADWLLRCKKVKLRSRALVDELVNFQQVAPGEYKGVRGDDRTMAALIAWAAWVQSQYRGVPMKDLREMLAKIHGAPSEAEQQAARAKILPEWTPDTTAESDDDVQAYRPRRRVEVEADW